MRNLIFGLLILGIFVSQCKSEEGNSPKYIFNGRIFNATDNSSPLGLPITLKAHNLADGLTKYKEEILGKAFTDSSGRFSISYKHSDLSYIDLSSQFFNYTDMPLLNKNIDTTFFRSTKGTICFNLFSDNPLTKYDTLYIGMPPLEKGQGAYIGKLPGPLSKAENFKFRTLKSTGGIQYFWAIGRIQWDKVIYFSDKFSQNKLSISMRGDPFIDTIKLKYR